MLQTTLVKNLSLDYYYYAVDYYSVQSWFKDYSYYAADYSVKGLSLDYSFYAAELKNSSLDYSHYAADYSFMLQITLKNLCM